MTPIYHCSRQPYTYYSTYSSVLKPSLSLSLSLSLHIKQNLERNQKSNVEELESALKTLWNLLTSNLCNQSLGTTLLSLSQLEQYPHVSRKYLILNLYVNLWTWSQPCPSCSHVQYTFWAPLIVLSLPFRENIFVAWVSKLKKVTIYQVTKCFYYK